MKRAVVLLLVAAIAACHPPPPRHGAIENRTADDGPRPITEQSLADFLSWRFARQLLEGTFDATYNGTEKDVLDELHTMGIHTTQELARIIPPDFDDRAAGEFVRNDPANIPGLVRDLLMIHDAHRYFGEAWKSRWQSIEPTNVSALRAYVQDFTPFYDAKVLTPDEVAGAPDANRELTE